MNLKTTLLLFLILCSVIYAVPVTNGLLAHYSFESSFADVSGNNYNANAYNGATLNTTGGINSLGSLVLDGTDDYLKVSNIPLSSNAGACNTVTFWMKWSGTNSKMPVGFYVQDLWLTSGYFGFNSGQGDVTGISSSGMENTWVHVAAVFYNGAPSASTHSLYINGVKQTIQFLQGNTPVDWPVPNYFYMGTWDGGGYNFGGELDEVMIFNRALNNTEVSQIYNYVPQVPEPSSTILSICAFFAMLLLRKKMI